MNADRDYFGGCHNVPMFADDISPVTGERCYCPSDCNCHHADIGRTNYCGSRNHPAPNGVTLADYVRTIDARRVVDQLELPAELLPRADGQLFS